MNYTQVKIPCTVPDELYTGENRQHHTLWVIHRCKSPSPYPMNYTQVKIASTIPNELYTGENHTLLWRILRDHQFPKNAQYRQVAPLQSLNRTFWLNLKHLEQPWVGSVSTVTKSYLSAQWWAIVIPVSCTVLTCADSMTMQITLPSLINQVELYLWLIFWNLITGHLITDIWFRTLTQLRYYVSVIIWKWLFINKKPF